MSVKQITAWKSSHGNKIYESQNDAISADAEADLREKFRESWFANADGADMIEFIKKHKTEILAFLEED